jgi:hypothetical protein
LLPATYEPIEPISWSDDLAGMIAVLIGATMVFVSIPRRDVERRLSAEYHAQDSARPA